MSARIALFAVLLSASACGREPRLRGPGVTCHDSTTCQTGLCSGGRCTTECVSDAACGPELRLCGPEGVCTNPCSRERSASLDGRRACVDSVEVACSFLDDRHCDVCEDKCPTQRCIPEVGCAPLSDVDGPCLRDDDCRTGNCSLFAGVCRVPFGSSCVETNCDICISDDAGWSSCSRECYSTADTPDCPNRLCLGSTSTNFFYCRPTCDGACPESCARSSDLSLDYCDAAPGSAWTLTAPLRPLLAPCHRDSECEVGECVDAPSCVPQSRDCRGRHGFCSVACASAADCGTGGQCVELACPPGSTENCGPRCLPACDPTDFEPCPGLADAECRTLPTVAGGTTPVCDPRNGLDERCSADHDCASGVCNSTSGCGEPGGNANGSSCASNPDCASGNCQSGFCRGTALRGDPCETSWDCGVGTCTSGVCD